MPTYRCANRPPLMMRPTYPTPLLLLLLLLPSTTLAQYTFVNNFYWQDYTNDCEATCLTNVFNVQQCTLANACNNDNCLTLEDSCLCGTSSWLTAVSQCIGKSCGAGAVYEAAAITGNACNSSDTAMSMSEDKIIQVGLAAAPSTSQATGVQPTTSMTTTTSKPTTSPTPSSDGGSGGLSTKSVIIGVVTSIVGVVVGIVGVFVAWKTYKHSKHAHQHTGSQHNVEAASSRTALIPLPAGSARGSLSEELTSQRDAPLPPPAPSLPPPAQARRRDNT
jgi:hypothetical protein